MWGKLSTVVRDHLRMGIEDHCEMLSWPACVCNVSLGFTLPPVTCSVIVWRHRHQQEAAPVRHLVCLQLGGKWGLLRANDRLARVQVDTPRGQLGRASRLSAPHLPPVCVSGHPGACRRGVRGAHRCLWAGVPRNHGYGTRRLTRGSIKWITPLVCTYDYCLRIRLGIWVLRRSMLYGIIKKGSTFMDVWISLLHRTTCMLYLTIKNGIRYDKERFHI